jgi:putative hydrolase of the HAD superfamily
MDEPWPVHTIVCDLDDTLFAERDYALSGFDAVDRHLREVHRVEGFGREAKALFEAGVRGTIFDRALERLGHPAETALVGELVGIYRAHPPRLE